MTDPFCTFVANRFTTTEQALDTYCDIIEVGDENYRLAANHIRSMRRRGYAKLCISTFVVCAVTALLIYGYPTSPVEDILVVGAIVLNTYVIHDSLTDLAIVGIWQIGEREVKLGHVELPDEIEAQIFDNAFQTTTEKP